MRNIENEILAKLIHCDRNIRIDIIPYLADYEFAEDNQIIFDAIVDLHNKDAPKTGVENDVDQVILYHYLKNKGKMNDNLGLHLGQLNTIGLDYTNIFNMIGVLLDGRYKTHLRETVTKGLKEIETGADASDIEEVKHGLISDLNQITIEQETEYMDFDKYKQMYLKHAKSGGGTIGFSWGKYLNGVNDITSGIVKPRVYIVGGLKKSGKTRFLIHTIKELYNQNIKIAFLSLEMPESEVSKMLIASFTDINDAAITGDRLSLERQSIIGDLEIDKEMIKIDCASGINIGEVISKIKKYKKIGCEVIFIDYIQRIMHDDKRQAQELENISIRISDITRKENISIIMASQLANISERETPTIGHLKGSGGIGESADSIILIDNIYRRTKQDADLNTMDFYFEQRYGMSGKQRIQCDLGSIQFRDLIRSEII